MSSVSKIEWTDATWNPVRGCTKISPGCKNCYALTFAERFRGVPGHPYEQGFDLRVVPGKLLTPLTWQRPRMVFVNSMSDLFHSGVETRYIEAVVDVMIAADWHVFQVLTKRASRMAKLLAGPLRDAANAKNIWWGVSVENKRHGLPRLTHLREIGSANTFVSAEPLLEDLGCINLSGINWVIVGGESGPRSRPMAREWVVTLREQCFEQDVPFFFKQWGGVQKSKTGRLLDGRTYDEFPKFASQPAPSKTKRADIIDRLSPTIDGFMAARKEVDSRIAG